MRKIKVLFVFIANISMMILSWVFYKYPGGDEYLVLFMFSLIFMGAPFILRPKMMLILLLLNVGFFAWYVRLGALNPVDVFVLTTLLVCSAGACFLVKTLFYDFLVYHKRNIRAEERRYHNIVNDLDVVDRRGRKIENELNRISRLYEITKQLAPALKFEDLLNALFTFLAKNIRFQTAHLLTFKDGNFRKGISRDTGAKEYYDESDKKIDYSGVVDYCEKKGFRPIYVSGSEEKMTFDKLQISSDSFMVFPLFVGDKISAILAIEGASRSSYGRICLLLPQITLEFRKVELYEQVQELSIIDGLTEVYLRRYLNDRLEEEVDRARRLGLTFSISMVDVDHFKNCNDKYGHLVGDAVLKRISEKLRNSVREVDMIARYGGEEFCILLPETTKDLAMTVSERLRRSIAADEIKAFDEHLKMTVSVGVATFPEDGDMVELIIEKADTALYKAKRKGRNTVCQA